ncbi:MAG: TIGR02996 domain-containing protein [Planctomycetes bacterium]|nr:TIGR02996 domain-containing protein [Planctomycetota bacterium]
MSDRDALIAAILANPDEDTPRLVFADWLDEHGDAPRAEFIRVQCELARQREAEADLPESFGTTCSDSGEWVMVWRPHDTEERIALLKREAELLRAHANGWMSGLPPFVMNGRTRHALRFRRGFVGRVQAWLGPLTTGARELWKRNPVESVWLIEGAGGARKKLPACRSLATLREIQFTEPRCDASWLEPYAECPHLAGVRTQIFGYGLLTDAAARLLARAPHLRPEALTFNGHELSADALGALLHAPFVERLRRLRPWRVPEWGPEVLAGAPLGELRLLDLSSHEGGDAGVMALTRSKHLTKLVTLDLGHSGLTDAALETLAAWPGLASVRALNLGDNKEITARGVSALLGSPHLKPIHLGLRWTGTGDEGAEALAKWPGLASLIDLDLSYAHVADAGVAALARSSYWRDIRYLKLSGNERIAGAAAGRLRERIGGRKIDIWGY